MGDLRVSRKKRRKKNENITDGSRSMEIKLEYAGEGLFELLVGHRVAEGIQRGVHVAQVVADGVEQVESRRLLNNGGSGQGGESN